MTIFLYFCSPKTTTCFLLRIMSNYIPTAQLGFAEAVRLASTRITDFKGRSRRSEFWWWMLVVLLLNIILGMVVPSKMMVLGAVVSTAVMALGLSATVRRLQDAGHNAAWVHVSYALGIFSSFYMALCMPEFMTEYMEILENADPKTITGTAMMNELMDLVRDNLSSMTIYGIMSLLWYISCLPVVIFCMIDGQPEDNEYGQSPKYVLH